MLVSCEKSVYKGFDKMENGAYMQFHDVNNQGDMPQIGDFVVVEVKQTLGDSLFYSTEYEEGGALEFDLT